MLTCSCTLAGTQACKNCSNYKKYFGEQTAGFTSRNENGGKIIIKTNYEEVDNAEIQKSVHLLDLFAKTFCRYQNDYERFDDLKFRCDECPFSLENGECQVKLFKIKCYPDYKDFGTMGDF